MAERRSSSAWLYVYDNPFFAGKAGSGTNRVVF